MTRPQVGNIESTENKGPCGRKACVPWPTGPRLLDAARGFFSSLAGVEWRAEWFERVSNGACHAPQILVLLREEALALAGVQSSEECLERIVQDMPRLPGVDCCGVLLPDFEARVLRLAAHQGVGPDMARQHAALPLDSAFGAQVLGGKPCWHYDVAAAGAGNRWPAEEGERLRSVLVLPLVLQGGLLAAVAIGSHAADRLPEVSCHAAGTLALLAGGALHRVKCREASAASESRLRLLLEHSVAGVAIVDAAGVLIQVNRRFERLSGIGVEEVRTRQVNLREIIEPSELGGLAGWIHARIHSLEEAAQFDCELRKRAGRRIRIQMAAGRIIWNDQPCLFISAREGPRAHPVQVRAPAVAPTELPLARELLQACDREREQVGRDLHDMLGSHMTGLAYLADALARRLRDAAPGEVGATLQLRDEALKAHQHLRRVVLNMSPSPGAAEPLAAGLKRLCENACLWPGIACRLENLAGDLTVAPETANHLQCIANEAFSNAVRHGKARDIVISLACEDGEGLLVIDDDGCGLGADGQYREGSGMPIMRFRAAALGGTLAIEARPEGGASVRCTFALPRQAQLNAEATEHETRTLANE